MSTLQGTLLSFYIVCDEASYDEVTGNWSPSGSHAYYFHNGTNELGTNVVWQGQEYTAFPLQVEGFEVSGNGKMPRPVIRVSNVGQYLSSISRAHNELTGWCVIRKRTFAMFIDAENFTNGNPNANFVEEFPQDLYYIDRKVEDNKLTIAWELAAASDLQGVQLPAGQIVANYCPAEYNYYGHIGDSLKCRYGQDSSQTLTTCDHSLDGANGCNVHFPDVDGKQVDKPFAGFPGCGLNRA